MSHITIVWFRRDLRLDDHPALCAAVANSQRVIPIYIYAPEEEAPWEPGAASRWWLHHSLLALDQTLRERGSRLLLARGDSLAILRQLIAATGATQVLWNRLYDPALCARDTQIKEALRADGCTCASFNSALLFEPWEIRSGNGQPYRVFTAFWRTCVKELYRHLPLAAPAQLPPPPEFKSPLPPFRKGGQGGFEINALDLLPRHNWDQGLRETWKPGEANAVQQITTFLAHSLTGYATQRDLPSSAGTSRLSAALHFGEISPRRVVELVLAHGGEPTTDPWMRELGWREFAYHLLYHFPHTTTQPLDRRFAEFPWRSTAAAELSAAWQRGQTGIPLVDAGMRELWHTGWMHNRVRMVVASLLTKNLQLPWQGGAQWFWDTLVDADLAINTASWQWTAGCGADAAPYFRVFNPVLQGERFDPAGIYVRRWCPELARLPDRVVHQPWTAPAATLAAAGVRLGENYPQPVVDLAASRREALAAWDMIKTQFKPDK
jgi:deoxyribodipyrimidine photo-lyase